MNILLFFKKWDIFESNVVLRKLAILLRNVEYLLFIRPLMINDKGNNHFFVFGDSQIIQKLSTRGDVTVFYENILSEKEMSHIKNMTYRLYLKWKKQKCNYKINLIRTFDKEFIENAYKVYKTNYILHKICVINDVDAIYHEYNLSSRNATVLNPILPKKYFNFKLFIINFILINIYKNNIDFMYEDVYEVNPNMNNNKILYDLPYVNYYKHISQILKLSSESFNVFVHGSDEDIAGLDLPYKKHVDPIRNRKVKWDLKLTIDPIFIGKSIFSEILIYDFFNLLLKKIPILLSHAHYYENFINTLKPNILIVGDDQGPSYVRTHVLVCQELGIKVINIQHGVLYDLYPLSEPISDYICVWGQYTKNILKRYGVNDEKILITGSPHYDYLYNNKKKILKINYDHILFITQPTYLSYISQLINKFQKISNSLILIVKPHPSQSGHNYYPLISKKVKLVNPRANLEGLLNKYDVVLAFNSAAILEVALMQKIIFIYNIPEKIEYFQSLGIIFNTVNELILNLNEMKNDEMRYIEYQSNLKRELNNHILLNNNALHSILELIDFLS
jgi:hypothetical protein